MSEDDPFRTLGDLSAPVAEELAGAGFEDAREIGRGGFGVVYRCTQPDLDRTVAVKILTTELDPDSQARFLREERAMGQLTGHPNIVTMLQAGTTADGHPFFVMPYHPLGSLDAHLREHGPLSTRTVWWIGVKIAGALESAHRLGIVHRDVKPGNILLTDYGEPALTDFGIAHITGGFQTATGTLTGSPAFTAPEVLEGRAPTPAADVYGLGATLFCALTGHAAFERHSGENVVAQFLRITTQPVPDLRDYGIAEDASTLIATAMNRDPGRRPSAAALGETIRQMQRRHGYAVEEMALQAEPATGHRDRTLAAHEWSPPSAAASVRGPGAFPLELTSFVGRRSELTEVKNLLSTTRLVTLTGIGGVGKTRLALRVAANARREFADGVWLVELAHVSDPSLLIDIVAVALGLRDESARPLPEALVELLSTREALVILDNCEQLVAAVAELVATWLRACPQLRVLVTSREPLDIAGEATRRVAPLTVPDPDHEPVLRELPRYDAVTLFADRATALVPDFELTADNKTAVAGICSRLDGLPLAIELAAARMRTMSPEQILRRLDDRYALLTRASRIAPARQQTLRWCIDWSHQLCTPAEQRLWAYLSVFAGGFELDAAEQVCGADLEPDLLLDVLSALVDKSILIRDESSGAVRFRVLETIRDYGRQKLQESGEDQVVRRRHSDWYRQLAMNAEAEWVSDRQLYWTTRLERELPNLREALEHCLAEDTEQAAETGLRTASALFIFWAFRGLSGEGRRWIERALAHPRAHSITDRVKALHAGAVLAAMRGDIRSSSALVKQAELLVEQDPTPLNRALTAYADGVVAHYSGELTRSSASFESAISVFDSRRWGYLYAGASGMLAHNYALQGDTRQAIERHERLLAVLETCGEFHFRSTSLWGLGIAVWLQGQNQRAQELFKQALRVNRGAHSPFAAVLILESLAWTHGLGGDAEYATVLMGATEELWRLQGSIVILVPGHRQFHDECERETRAALGTRRFEAALRRGRAMGMDSAIAYALGEHPAGATRTPGPGAVLTKRELQVADLVAEGLTNKQIATKLVISQRTAQGHVENILTKLGFTSRSQIAAWIAEDRERQSHRQS